MFTLPPLLRDRIFRRFWLGQTTSLVGDEISLLVIPLVGVLVLDASAAQMGYLTAVGVAPSLLFSVYAGAWLDRRGRRRQAMMHADIGRALLLASIPIAYVLDVLALPQLYFVAFAIGSLDVIFAVAYMTVFVSMVRPQDYLSASALLNGSRALAGVGGKSVGGLLVAVLSAPVVLLFDVATFVASALFLWRINPVEPPTAEPERGDIAAGMRFIATSRIVRACLGATATVNYFNYVFYAIFVLYAVRELGVSGSELGFVLGAASVGAIVGALVTGRLSRYIGVGRAFIVSCVLFPAPLLLVPAASGHGWHVLVLLFLAEFGSGVGVMLLDITVGGIFAAVIPDDMRARVAGAYRTVNYGMRPLGALTGGALGSWIGLRPTLWIGAVGGVCCVFFTLTRAVRELRSLSADPVPEDIAALAD